MRRPGCSGACSNNTRWLILAKVRLPHLSSQVLSRITRRLSRPSFKDLIGCLRETLAGFYDRRTGDNCSCAMEDFGLSAFAVFFTQAPSFLAHQKAMQTARGANKPLPPPLIPIPAPILPSFGPLKPKWAAATHKMGIALGVQPEIIRTDRFPGRPRPAVL